MPAMATMYGRWPPAAISCAMRAAACFSQLPKYAEAGGTSSVCVKSGTSSSVLYRHFPWARSVVPLVFGLSQVTKRGDKKRWGSCVEMTDSGSEFLLSVRSEVVERLLALNQ
eukprot:scaffold4825_cov153-Amphora_coffeaeformis.AAC.7